MKIYAGTTNLPVGTGYAPRWSDFKKNVSSAAARWAPRFRGFYTQDELFAEGMERFFRCAEKYGSVDTAAHFNKLLSAALFRRYTDLLRYNYLPVSDRWLSTMSLDSRDEKERLKDYAVAKEGPPVVDELRELASSLTEFDYEILEALEGAEDRLHFLSNVSGRSFATLVSMVCDE